MRTTRILALTAVGVLSGALTACSGDKTDDAVAAAGTGGPITVKASDDSCMVSRNTLDAGTTVFSITNGGSKVTEFYVYAPGDRVMAEVENIAPGLSRELHVELPAGSYETACKPGMIGKGIRNAFTVSGSAAPLAEDAKLKAATDNYSRYVKSQTAALETKTAEFVAAVKANDVAKAKALFPVSRTYWERIEPVAESFGDLDPKIDARVNDVEPGTEWTGYHRIEQALWVSNSTKGMEKYADQLLADVKTVVAKAKTVKLTPLQLANGAKELLDEVATGKVTGEEDRYSHTDLWDFQANVEGSQAAIQALRPALQKRDAALVTQLDTQFKAVFASLDKYREGDGFKPYTATEPEKKALGAVVDGLAEPVSKVAAVLAKK